MLCEMSYGMSTIFQVVNNFVIRHSEPSRRCRFTVKNTICGYNENIMKHIKQPDIKRKKKIINIFI